MTARCGCVTAGYRFNLRPSQCVYSPCVGTLILNNTHSLTCNSGNVDSPSPPQVYNAQNGSLVQTLVPGGNEPMPVTCLRWRPSGSATTTTATSASAAGHGGLTSGAAAAKGRHVLLACGADGMIRHWHVTSGKLMSKLAEPGNQIFACDYRKDGYFFATGGKDRCAIFVGSERVGDGAVGWGA